MYSEYSEQQLKEEHDRWHGHNQFICKNVQAEMRKRTLKPEVKLTRKQLFALNKWEQVKLLKAKGKKVPRYEKDRVELLLKLQK